MSETRAVVLLSGGMDSTTLLHHVAKNLHYEAILAVSFLYGQRHSKELDCARFHAAKLNTEFVFADISFLGGMLKEGTSLIEGGSDIPHLTDLKPADLDQPPTYVPNRNMMLLSLAAALAEARKIRDVFYGAHMLDEYGYWDCTTEFIRRLDETLALNRRNPITVHAPFADMTKADILRCGFKLGVDYSRTWSCYRGGETACGTCPTCVERLNAFREAGETDPLPYAATVL